VSWLKDLDVCMVGRTDGAPILITHPAQLTIRTGLSRTPFFELMCWLKGSSA